MAFSPIVSSWGGGHRLGGKVILEHDRILAIDLRNPPEGFHHNIAPDENQSASSGVVSDFRGHQELIEDSLHAIEGNTAPICNGLEGRKSLALVKAIYRAAGRKPGQSPMSDPTRQRA